MNAPFNRGTGLIIIEARNSNPNGDPDQESDPRTLEADGRGVISPVSFKRKLRDIVLADGDVMAEARDKLKLGKSGNEFRILEDRNRRLSEIKTMDAASFKSAFWDARVFGNTLLEAIKGKGEGEGAEDEVAGQRRKKSKSEGESLKRASHFVSTGVVQVGVGLSVTPVDIDRMTTTNIPVEEGKTAGMAPLGFRVVRHAVYFMPFFVNPSLANKTGATEEDIELLKFLLPYAYSQTASAIRPFVTVLHAWYAEHKTPLGSCPDALFVDALIPKFLKDDAPSTQLKGEYEIPTADGLPAELKDRFIKIADLCDLKD